MSTTNVPTYNGYTKFIVTGKDTRGKRFRMTYEGTPGGFMTADMINLWNGSVWGILPNGKRKRLKRVIN